MWLAIHWEPALRHRPVFAFTANGLPDVARRAGVGLGTLYRHFPTREALLTGTRLLDHAHAAGVARADIDGTDLFALVGALAWLYDQPSLALRADHLFGVISSAVLPDQSGRLGRSLS
jgi:AcrR family transcriptional regulator